MSRSGRYGALVALTVFLAACGGSETSASLADYYPGEGAVPGWAPEGVSETFDEETIFQLVNGQADFFFAYGFELVAVRHYQDADENVLDVQIWQLSDDENAYGLFTASVGGEPAPVGNDGDADPGRRLVFWQDRYVVRMFARKEIPAADLLAMGEAVAEALPTGGERPDLLARLPDEGKVARSELFFHKEIAVQNEIWLGGENLLGLSAETDGVIARYGLAGGEAQLMLVRYPGAGAAEVAMAALEASDMVELLALGMQDDLLGAVFGGADPTAAGEFLGSVFVE